MDAHVKAIMMNVHDGHTLVVCLAGKRRQVHGLYTGHWEAPLWLYVKSWFQGHHLVVIMHNYYLNNTEAEGYWLLPLSMSGHVTQKV